MADCAYLPFLDGSLDSVASDSLFEHMRFPHETIKETFRVLAPGGVMQINTPFFFTIHNYPGDYMRLTPHFLEEICREVGFERVYCHVYDFGGLYYTLYNSCKAVTVDETQEESVVRSAKKIHLNLTILLMLVTVFDSLFYGHARNFFIGVYCAALKAGEPPRRPSLHAASANFVRSFWPPVAIAWLDESQHLCERRVSKLSVVPFPRGLNP